MCRTLFENFDFAFHMTRVALLAILVAPFGARAESVHLLASGGEQGQGWLFRDPGTGFCGVVTAAHVAFNEQGTARKITIEAADMGSGVGVDTVMLSPPRTDHDRDSDNPLDVAVMRVEGELAQRGCTTATLGDEQQDDALLLPGRGVAEAVNGGDADEINVSLSSYGLGDHSRIGVTVDQQSRRIAGGDSGAPIVQSRQDRLQNETVKPLPLALLTNVAEDGDHAEAVGFGEIRALILRARILSPSNSGTQAYTNRRMNRLAWGTTASPLEARWVQSHGRTADLNCPANNAIDPSAACGWRAMPEQGERSVSIVIAPTMKVTSHVALAFPGASGVPVTVTVETTQMPGSGDWTWAKTATVSAGLASIDFLPLQAQWVRISISGGSSASLEIRVEDVR